LKGLKKPLGIHRADRAQGLSSAEDFRQKSQWAKDIRLIRVNMKNIESRCGPASLAWAFQSQGLVYLLSISILFLWPGQALAVSQSEELEIGKQVHQEISGQKLLFNDPMINAYFQKVCQRVLRAAGKQPYPFRFYIIQSDSLNAFAVPGGYIYLHTETLASLENEGQLAAILAHEVAHITSRHFARRMEAAKSITLMSMVGLLAGVALASSGGGGQNIGALGEAVMMGSTGASVQAMLAHSRADESEADRKGRDYMIKAGYNARDMYGAFYIMNEKSYQLSANIPGYLSTHPGITSRLATTFSDYKNAPKAGADPAYQAIKDRVLALTAQGGRARNYFAKRLSENKSDASALHGLGLLAARDMDYSRADKYFKEALSLSPGRAEYLSDLGDLALKRRQPEEAARYYSDSRKAGGGGVNATLGLARASELLGRNKEAASYYDTALSEAGDTFPEALELAGRFFGQNGQIAKGHYVLAKFFESTGQLKDAVFHYKAAISEPGGGTYRTRGEQAIRDIEALMEKTKGKKG
jgi:predicted Zn-dependent protease